MKYKIIPISWINRKEGTSKFDIKEVKGKIFIYFGLLFA